MTWPPVTDAEIPTFSNDTAEGRSVKAFRLGAFRRLGMAAYLAMAPLMVASIADTRPVIDHSARITVPSLKSGWEAAAVAQSAWASNNWSGYAETGTFTGVSSQWTVPTIAASSTASYSSTWIGIDGFNNGDLIQTGTEQDYYGSSAHYYAWWEILPAAQSPLPVKTYPVSPGDRMTGEIYKTASGEWVISVVDTTKKWSFSVEKTYSGPGTSAEWIMEAPEVGGAVSTLAHYTVAPPSGHADFDSVEVATAVSRTTAAPAFSSARLAYSHDAGYMVQHQAAVSTPGTPDTALTGFNIAYGSNPAPTPAG
jgi:hypothetical protein